MCISPLSLLIIFIFFVVEWKVHQDYMTLTTILFLPSKLTHITTPFNHTNKENNNSTEFVSIPISDPIPIPITAARSRFRLRRPVPDYGGPIPIPVPIDLSKHWIVSRFPIQIHGPEFRSRFTARVTVPSNDQDSDYGGPIPFSVSGPIDLAIRVSLSKQSINTYQSSAPKHRIVFLTKHDLYVQISLSKQSPCTVSAKETPSSRSAVPFFFSLLP